MNSFIQGLKKSVHPCIASVQVTGYFCLRLVHWNGLNSFNILVEKLIFETGKISQSEDVDSAKNNEHTNGKANEASVGHIS